MQLEFRFCTAFICVLLLAIAEGTAISCARLEVNSYVSPCGPDDFRCGSKECISSSTVCDEDGDCDDESDEKRCYINSPCPRNEFKCGTKRCVPQVQVCDGVNDCGDSSDENSTICQEHGVLCAPNQFKCKNNKCILSRLTCDGVCDCPDGSDEANCTYSNICGENEFKCDNEECIAQDLYCNGEPNCADNTDESSCTVSCKATEFKCDSERCVQKSSVCDGKYDCGDVAGGSDENRCSVDKTNGTCPDYLFTCNHGTCIPWAWVCDGKNDCPDSCDEVFCMNATDCPVHTFQCKSGGCVSYKSVCLASKNCSDNSDEEYCSGSCPIDTFECQNKKCIPLNWTCDGFNHCLDETESDESRCGPSGLIVDEPDPVLPLPVILCLVMGLIIVIGIVSSLAIHFSRGRKVAESPLSRQNSLQSPLNEYQVPGHKAPTDLALPEEYVIQPSELEMDESKCLGEGQFGKVFQGVYRGEVVAIKTVKPTENADHLRDFLKEIQMIAKIGYHPNIVKFYGAETSKTAKEILLVVLELSPLGSLCDYLRKNSTILCLQRKKVPGVPSAGVRVNESQKLEFGIPLKQLVSWAEQVAQGMCHLQDKNIIHGDLATRNVLLFTGGVVKLSDFGLARSLYQPIYKKQNLGPLPWRWMALESLQHFEFSSKSDVWAYGITLWEIFSFGIVPFPGLTWDENFQRLLISGLRPLRPQAAPFEMYESVMLPCWELHPDNRPDFHRILDILHYVRAELGLPKEIDADVQVARYENIAIV